MEAFKQVAAVAGVLSLLLGCLWWLRRRGSATGIMHSRAKRRLELLERLPLGPQSSLHLVRLGKLTLLLALSPAGCVLVERCRPSDIESTTEAIR